MVEDSWVNNVVEPQPALLVDDHPEVSAREEGGEGGEGGGNRWGARGGGRGGGSIGGVMGVISLPCLPMITKI